MTGRRFRAAINGLARRAHPRAIAVVDGSGRLVGNLDPRAIMEEMGRVESLIDDFEREVFM